MAFGLIPWRMVAAVVPTTAAIMGDSLIYVVLPVSAAEFGIGGQLGLTSGVWIGVALSINRFIRLFSNGWAATIYRRFGLRPPFVTSVALGALTTLAYSFSHGIWLLLAARALWGVSYSFLRLASYMTALEPANAGIRGRLIGFFNAGQRLGSLIAVTAGAYLVTATDRTTAFTIIAATGLAGVLVSMYVAPLSTPVRPLRAAAPARSATWSLRDRLWAFALTPLPISAHRLRAALLSVAVARAVLAFAANGLIIATVAPYLRDIGTSDSSVFGTTVAVVTLAGLVVGTRWFADLALSVPLGYLSDRVGRRAIVIAGVGVSAGAAMVLAIADGYELAVIALPMLFIASVAAQTALETQFGESVPDESRASALGRFSTWLDLGAAIGALVGLPLAEAAGYATTFMVAAVLLLAAGTWYARTTRPSR